MTHRELTMEQLKDYLAQELVRTTQQRANGGSDAVVWRNRGRADAFLQVMGWIDQERMEALRAEWERAGENL